MRLSYVSEDVQQQVIKISKHYPKLYQLFMLVLTKLKSFDFADLELHIGEELARSANSKQIKYLPNEKAYEYRIPPHCKSGVIRMLFQVEDDYWTICIKKDGQKVQNPPKNRREDEKRGKPRNSSSSA